MPLINFAFLWAEMVVLAMRITLDAYSCCWRFDYGHWPYGPRSWKKGLGRGSVVVGSLERGSGMEMWVTGLAGVGRGQQAQRTGDLAYKLCVGV